MLPDRNRSICLFLPAVVLLFCAPLGSIQISKSAWIEKDITLLEFVSPDYPALARAAVLEGSFELQVQIGANGRILRINRVDATLNIDKANAAELFWDNIEKELRESWRFSVPTNLASESLVPIQLVFVLDDVPDRSNCNRTRVEVKLHPLLRLVIHGVKPHPQEGLRPRTDNGKSRVCKSETLPVFGDWGRTTRSA